jgi:hypothetical protein
MTTFSGPLLIKTNDAEGPGTLKVTYAFQTTIDIGKTGAGAASTTVLPLFTAPAGTTFDNVVVDIVDAFDNLAANNTNITVGISGATNRLLAATSLNTVGRRAYAPTTAQISVNAIPLTADTAIQAIVSINTSAVTVGKAYLTIFMK